MSSVPPRVVRCNDLFQCELCSPTCCKVQRSVSVLYLVLHELRGRWGSATVCFSMSSVSPRVVRCYGLLQYYFQSHELEEEGATVCFSVISGHPRVGGWLLSVLVLSLVIHVLEGGYGLF